MLSLPTERVDSLPEWLLWDADYGDDRVLDDPPPVRDAVMTRMRIPERYFVAVAPDPAPAEMAALGARLRALV